jgi:high-affinity K+ transport system ATPase subunit B
MKNYWKPTPKKWRKIGDALLAVSTTVTTYAIADDWAKWLQVVALLTGVLGKFLTNLFSE